MDHQPASPENEERFRLAARAANDALYDWDIVANTVWRSDGYQRILYMHEPPTNELNWLLDRVHPDDRSIFDSGYPELFASRRDLWMVEYRVRRQDGSYAHVIDRGYLMRAEDGTPLRLVGALIDMTERIIAESSVRKSEARFRTVFARAAVGMVLVDSGGHTLESNPAMQYMLGYTDEELRQMPFTQFAFPDDVAADVTLAAQLMAGHIHHYEMEKRYIRKDKQVIWGRLLVSKIPSTDLSEPIAVVMVEDISRRKEAEQALHYRDAVLETLTRVSEQFLRAADLSAVIPDVLAQLGQTIDVSRAQIYQTDQENSAPETGSLKYEWVATGIRPMIETLAGQNIRYTAVGISDMHRAADFVFRSDHSFSPEAQVRMAAVGTLAAAVLPIFCGDTFWGALAFSDSKRDREWHPVEIEMMRNAASAFGAALLRQRAETAEREQRLLAEALREGAAALTSTLEPAIVMARILSNVGRVVPHTAANIMLIKDDVAEVVYSQGYTNSKTFHQSHRFRDFPNLCRMTETALPVVIPDTKLDADWRLLPETAWLRSYAGAPLRVHGIVIGFLNLDSTIPGFFNALHAERLQAFADQAAVAIENAQLYDTLRGRAHELEQRITERTHDLQAAAEVSKQITTALDFDDLLPQLVTALLEKFDFYDVSVFLVDDTKGALPYRPNGSQRVQRIDNARLQVNVASAVIRAAQTRQPIVINNVFESDTYLPDPTMPDTKAELALPLIIGDQLLGVLDLRAKQINRFTPDCVRISTNLAEQISIAIRNTQLFAEVKNARRESEILYRMSSTVNAASSYPAILGALLSEIGPLDYGIALSLYDDYQANRPNGVTVVAVADPGQAEARDYDRRLVFPVIERVAIPLTVVEDVADFMQIDELQGQFYQSLGMRAMLTAKVMLGERTIGSLSFFSEQPRVFTDFERRLIGGLAGLAAASVERTRVLLEAKADRQAAEDANRVKSQFLANMSHELRTPLNAILNFTAFVADGVFGPVNDEQTEALQQALSSGKHLLSLINDILDLTKIEVGLMDLFIQEVNVNEALAASVSVAKGLIKDKPLGLDTDIEPKLPPIFGDKRRIRQIFLNLVSNAVKFTAQGTIDVRARHEADAIHVIVRDTGIGIAPEDQDLIFESFKQVSSDLADMVGTGLGLPISRFFAEAHGGKLWLESELGKGSAFHVLLPIRSEADANAANTQSMATR